MRKCQDLPGQDLFQYVEEAGKVRDITSSDVNDYLARIAGADFTAKDFRTWTGTVLAALALREFQPIASKRWKSWESAAARHSSMPAAPNLPGSTASMIAAKGWRCSTRL